MELQTSQRVLQALAEGVDPTSGEVLATDGVFGKPEVKRALLAGIAALESARVQAQRRSQLPGNVGSPWTASEEQKLAAAFKAGEALTDIAARHGRTLAAIEARLERMKLIAPEQRITRNRYVANEPHERG